MSTESANERLGLAPTDPRPADETQPLVDRARTNPLFGDQKMKLGLFGTNCSYGLTMSHVPSGYEVTWEHTKQIAQRADQIGFDLMLPVARWKGFGGSTNFNGNCFETYTWAAGIAEATERIAVSRPRTCRRCTRSSRPSRPPRSTTSPAADSRSTW